MAEFKITTVGIDSLTTYSNSGPVADLSWAQTFYVDPNLFNLTDFSNLLTVQEQYDYLRDCTFWGYGEEQWLPGESPGFAGFLIKNTPDTVTPKFPPSVLSAVKGLNLNTSAFPAPDFNTVKNIAGIGVKQGIGETKYKYTIDPQYGTYRFNLMVIFNSIGVADSQHAEGMPIFAAYLFDNYIKKNTNEGAIQIDAVIRHQTMSATSMIEWNVEQGEFGAYNILGSVDALPKPKSTELGSNNTYLINSDDDVLPNGVLPYGRDSEGNSFTAYLKGDELWAFSSHYKDLAEGVTIVSATNTSLVYDDSANPLDIDDITEQGRFVIQFKNNSVKGYCRSVSSINTTTKTITWVSNIASGVDATEFELLDSVIVGGTGADSSVDPVPDTLVLRDGNGRSKVEDPVAPKDIVNLRTLESFVPPAPIESSKVLDDIRKHTAYKRQHYATRSNMGADLSGSGKWYGGVLGPDGKIYGIPRDSSDILIIDPITGTATRSNMGAANLSGGNKWFGGVLGIDGKIYGIPHVSTDILIIDLIAGTATRSDMGADLSGSGKWSGGVLGPDGKIYGIPNTSSDILIIDPIIGTATRSDMGADLSGSGIKWEGGVLGTDGKIYGIPRDSPDILIIDTINGTATRSDMGASMPVGGSKWCGGSISLDGKIYGIPYESPDILIIDPIAGTATRNNMGASLGGSSKWQGGVLGTDGKIYGMPRDSTDILIIDPIAGTATRSNMGADLSGSGKCVGGVLGTDGKIYGISYTAPNLLKIQPTGPATYTELPNVLATMFNRI